MQVLVEVMVSSDDSAEAVAQPNFRHAVLRAVNPSDSKSLKDTFVATRNVALFDRLSEIVIKLTVEKGCMPYADQFRDRLVQLVPDLAQYSFTVWICETQGAYSTAAHVA